MDGRYSLRSPAVKRLMREAKELQEPTEQYYAQPLEDNLFEWHFTVRGPPETEFQNGIYHGRIILPPEYPMKPPSIMLLTVNGRFETMKKICLSISGHHPESWQPSWSIRTALLAIIGFMPTPGGGAIGALDYTPDERMILAKRSHDWMCPLCGIANHDLLLPMTSVSSAVLEEAKVLGTQIGFKAEASMTPNSSSQSVSKHPSETSHSQQSSNESTDTLQETACLGPSSPVPDCTETTAGGSDLNTTDHSSRQPCLPVTSPEQNDQTVQSPSVQGKPTVNAQSHSSVGNHTASHVRQRVAPTTMQVNYSQMGGMVEQNGNGSSSIIAMIVLSLVIAVLVARRMCTSLPWHLDMTEP